MLMSHPSDGSATTTAPTTSPVTGAPDPAVRRRVVAASFIGNFVEWFDYAIYGYLAATIAVVFFPESDPQTALLATFALFAISFFVRPFGGFVWGHLGDKLGRRTALSLSILIMSVSTFCIALIPGYDSIGIFAPVLLLVVRIVQGFSAAGEYAGASAFLVEYAPDRRRGVYAAVVPASTATGLLFGSLFVAGLTAVLSDDQLTSWGWRIPFLLAAPMGLIGRYIRTKLEDTPAFQELAAEDEVITAPVRDMFRNHWGALLRAVGAVLLNAVGFYILLSYMPTYLSEEIGLGRTESFLATSLALLSYVGFIFLTGLASDRFGRKRMLMAASVSFIVLTVPAFMVLESGSFVAVLAVQVLLGAILSLNDGTLPSFLAELFPTRIRYTGFAVSFNLANAVFGGTAPFMATLLISAFATNLAPAWYLMAAAAVSFVAVALSRETCGKPLER
jgi:MHS family proline/betaine transporter-like MFS transporter